MNNEEEEIKPIMRIFCKRDFEQLKYKYKFANSIEEIINKAKETDVLVLKTQFRDGFHFITNVWILNEESEEVFRKLMFGNKLEEKN